MGNVLSLLESILGNVELEGKNWRFRCPFPGCRHSHRNNLSIFIETSEEGDNPWKCWSCGKSGFKIRSFFKKAFPGNQAYLDKIDSLIVPRYYTGKIHQPEEKICSLPEEFVSLESARSDKTLLKQQIVQYLNRRGISINEGISFNIGYCPTGRYENRVIIPSFDANGVLNYFVARTIIEDATPRYLTPDIPFKDIVPFEVYINWNLPIILCEGFFDAIAIRHNAMPLNGKDIHAGIMKKLLQSQVNEIYLCLDKDAIRNSLNHAERLLNSGKTVHLVELAQKDPSEIGYSEMSKIITATKPITAEEVFFRKMSMTLYE